MTLLPPAPIFGLVLAGGASRRMGHDKASLFHPDGRSQAARSLDLLKDAGCAEVFLSLRVGQAPPASIPDHTILLRDADHSSLGPLSGVLAAFRARPAADWLVIACDLPLLDVPTLARLISNRENHHGPIAYRNPITSAPEPLCAIYPATLRDRLEISWKKHHLRLRDHFHGPACLLLDCPSGNSLANTNTLSDWKHATGPSSSTLS